MINELSNIASSYKQQFPDRDEKNHCFIYFISILFNIDIKQFFPQDLIDDISPHFISFKLESTQEDIHFLYEQFLSIYDEEHRKKLGTWYTPTEIVSYMIRTVNHLLSLNFDSDLNSESIQVIDPATGTGTFISSLLHFTDKPEINVIELDPISLTFAHLNFLSINPNKQINIYNQNTLESPITFNKPKTRVVIGNPPYNGKSKNKSKFITDLMKDYKPDFNSAGGLNDDYIKFFRYGENLLSNERGILSFITNSSYLKSQAAQQMRKHLLQTFDDIYIINLNGMNNKQDENVFDIRCEVAIIFCVKKEEQSKPELANVYYESILGSRQFKFDWLNQHTLGDLNEEK